MLSRLASRDFAVVATAEIEFGRGMTVISGETGAGKSLLVDALGFLSGLRADSGMVRHGADRAELAAEFELADAPDALARSEEHTSELQSLMRISYAVFCLKKKKNNQKNNTKTELQV